VLRHQGRISSAGLSLLSRIVTAGAQASVFAGSPPDMSTPSVYRALAVGRDRLERMERDTLPIAALVPVVVHDKWILTVPLAQQRGLVLSLDMQVEVQASVDEHVLAPVSICVRRALADPDAPSQCKYRSPREDLDRPVHASAAVTQVDPVRPLRVVPEHGNEARRKEDSVGINLDRPVVESEPPVAEDPPPNLEKGLRVQASLPVMAYLTDDGPDDGRSGIESLAHFDGLIAEDAEAIAAEDA